jgi:hypothetical protein
LYLPILMRFWFFISSIMKYAMPPSNNFLQHEKWLLELITNCP